MLDEMPVAAVTLNELSRRVGLAKPNVLRYFESREAVLLELLDGWAPDVVPIDEHEFSYFAIRRKRCHPIADRREFSGRMRPWRRMQHGRRTARRWQTRNAWCRS